jgi:hypothetical protein
MQLYASHEKSHPGAMLAPGQAAVKPLPEKEKRDSGPQDKV